jgi:hypothetical protein
MSGQSSNGTGTVQEMPDPMAENPFFFNYPVSNPEAVLLSWSQRGDVYLNI